MTTSCASVSWVKDSNSSLCVSEQSHCRIWNTVPQWLSVSGSVQCPFQLLVCLFSEQQGGVVHRQGHSLHTLRVDVLHVRIIWQKVRAWTCVMIELVEPVNKKSHKCKLHRLPVHAVPESTPLSQSPSYSNISTVCTPTHTNWIQYATCIQYKHNKLMQGCTLQFAGACVSAACVLTPSVGMKSHRPHRQAGSWRIWWWALRKGHFCPLIWSLCGLPDKHHVGMCWRTNHLYTSDEYSCCWISARMIIFSCWISAMMIIFSCWISARMIIFSSWWTIHDNNIVISDDNLVQQSLVTETVSMVAPTWIQAR
jgi:hypothetical protein